MAAFGMVASSPMEFLLYFLLTLHILVCILMVLVVLMQRPRSEGLGAAFGSGMTENLFGAQTTHVLAKFTTWLGAAFFVLTLALAMTYSHIYNAKGDSKIQKQLMKMPAPKVPQATPTPVGSPLPEAQREAPTTPAAASLASPATSTPIPATTPAQPIRPLAPATPASTTP